MGLGAAMLAVPRCVLRAVGHRGTKLFIIQSTISIQPSANLSLGGKGAGFDQINSCHVGKKGLALGPQML